MLVLGIGIRAWCKGGKIAAQPSRGKLNEADLPSDLGVVRKRRVLHTVGKRQQGKNVLRSVGAGCVLAGTSLHRSGEDRTEVLLPSGILLGKLSPPDDSRFLRLRRHLPDVGIFLHVVGIDMKGIRTPDTG